jgi:hypothetical protein
MQNDEGSGRSSSISRRDFLGSAAAAAALVSSRSAAILASGLLAGTREKGKSAIGEWLDDADGLPCFHYTGPLSFHIRLKNGETLTPKHIAPGYSRSYLPEDPYFLLGNYRLTVFVHASGLYQILTGERGWGRMNQGDSSFSGVNRAAVEFGGKRYELVGMGSPAAAAADKVFGVGFARYRYQVTPAVEITRAISVRPSKKPGDGASALLVTVRMRNLGEAELDAVYTEDVRAKYEMISNAGSSEPKLVSYSSEVVRDDSHGILRADFHPHPAHPPGFWKGHISRLEGDPPSLFVQVDGDERVHTISEKDSAGHDLIGIRSAVKLTPGNESVLTFVVGYSRGSIDVMTALAAAVRPDVPLNPTVSESAFGKEWARVLPGFADEADTALRREMRWNAAVLEAMATYREYYDETAVPQGTLYDYVWGVWAVSRDFVQHALPLCHTNPALAKSILRFTMKRMSRDGEIKLEDMGFGWVSPGGQTSSDQQLYFFMLMAEYLRATKDVSILSEEVGYYPQERAGKGTGLDRIREAFLFLQEQVGTGEHGLVCMWGGDWNDEFYAEPGAIPSEQVFWTAESHMNSAMAVVILGSLISALESVNELATSAAPKDEVIQLVKAMREYRRRILDAYLRDWGTRLFPRRAYVSTDQIVGDKEMWLEPQGFSLQIPELDSTRKSALWDEIQRRLLVGEKQGCRQRENPSKGKEPWTAGGTRENGGFWWALQGPLILGVATFDRTAALGLVRRITFAHFADQFPQYWTGTWSASDSLDSSLVPTEGLSFLPVYCAHAHAWPLYCYLCLRQGNSSCASTA